MTEWSSIKLISDIHKVKYTQFESMGSKKGGSKKQIRMWLDFFMAGLTSSCPVEPVQALYDRPFGAYQAGPVKKKLPLSIIYTNDVYIGLHKRRSDFIRWRLIAHEIGHLIQPADFE